MRVIVVGAGVVGLSCALRLLEDGHDVAVLARDLPLETTSAVAAALWYPYRALPQDRVTAWASRSREVFTELAGDDATGVRLREGIEVFTEAQPDPWWAAAVPDLRRRPRLPDGYVDGWSFLAPVVEMPVYLTWLRDRVLAGGGSVTRLALAALPSGGDLVVNCSGLGARHLAGDPTVLPVRGQVAIVEQPGIDRWMLDGAGPTYVVPRADDVVVGGTDDEGEWDRAPVAEVTREILARATRLVPELAGARVLRTRVGLRPTRPVVRLERVGHVVHAYGLGGAGVTLSWGVADEVASLAGADGTSATAG
ncbi:FAD-dependent oxidoreductase [Nocardioides euryhalodurans]|uniref:D-amino-acid oxidase n=1 Tax=Nocardioides euryhalodurans TaxID=2518370 RepID=A0A4P7GJ01_9ACTN|nr:FAD-dependent oxidoreductase [Nocardioides euryhalodurans]QBR91709.1 FAD-dependent oxidoreductase [Nocardioides euryhalodurans]